MTIEEAKPSDWARHHTTTIMPNGVRLEFDSAAFAKQWDPGLSGMPGHAACVLFFGVDSRDEVDRISELAVHVGSRSQRELKDAFWGAKYAILEDPDGNAVGILSSIEPSRKYEPSPPCEFL